MNGGIINYVTRLHLLVISIETLHISTTIDGAKNQKTK